VENEFGEHCQLMIPIRQNYFRRAKLPRCSLLLAVPFLLMACAANEKNSMSLFSSAAGPNDSVEVVPGRSPSAMEALSRGVALITPSNAVLKDVYFNFDSTSLAQDAENILKRNAEWMRANPKARVEVEGHCDDVGSAEYNLALGAKRAQVVKDFLVNQGGVPSERLVTISYGKETPACFEATEECRIKNRRARFVMFTELPTS
jgi:peptidoglycan-associated lipoprotein